MYNPTTTSKPRIISTALILLLKKIGSMSDVKNAPVLIATRATETFETLMALKNVIQWSAIKIPDSKNLNNDFLSSSNDFFLIKKQAAIKKEANSILNQTNGMASIDINFPKMAVKPQIKTIKWRCK